MDTSLTIEPVGGNVTTMREETKAFLAEQFGLSGPKLDTMTDGDFGALEARCRAPNPPDSDLRVCLAYARHEAHVLRGENMHQRGVIRGSGADKRTPLCYLLDCESPNPGHVYLDDLDQAARAEIDAAVRKWDERRSSTKTRSDLPGRPHNFPEARGSDEKTGNELSAFSPSLYGNNKLSSLAAGYGAGQGRSYAETIDEGAVRGLDRHITTQFEDPQPFAQEPAAAKFLAKAQASLDEVAAKADAAVERSFANCEQQPITIKGIHGCKSVSVRRAGSMIEFAVGGLVMPMFAIDAKVILNSAPTTTAEGVFTYNGSGWQVIVGAHGTEFHHAYACVTVVHSEEFEQALRQIADAR